MALPCCKKRCCPRIPAGFISKPTSDVESLFKKCSTHTHKHFHQHYHEKVEPETDGCLLNGFGAITDLVATPVNPGVSIELSGLLVDDCCSCGVQNCLQIRPDNTDCKFPELTGSILRTMSCTDATEIASEATIQSQLAIAETLFGTFALAWNQNETSLFPNGYWSLSITNDPKSGCVMQKIGATVLLND